METAIRIMPAAITVACVKATSFPQGIMEAFGKIEKAYPEKEGRTHYGISHGDGNGGVVYYAAAGLSAEEQPIDGFTSYSIKAGKYIEVFVKDFMQDPTQIGRIFQKLVKEPNVDHESGYCLEIYEGGKHVHCLVKLED